MPEVVLFQPASAHNAKANLKDFIAFSKQLRPLGIEQPFESNEWSYGHLATRDPAASGVKLYFTGITRQDGRLKVPKRGNAGTPFDEPFLSFSKAIFSYMHAMSPLKKPNARIAALRFMELALRETTGSNCPTDVTPQVLNYACQRLIEWYKEPYCPANQVETLYKTMVKLCLVSIPNQWTNFIPANVIAKRRSGKEFDAVRNKKLPDPAALDALADIFNSPRDNADIAVTSVCALLCCAPDRIIETLTLPLDCIARTEDTSEGVKPGISLRWFPAKNGKPMLKRVIPSMADTARKAIDNLKAIGTKARALARWYERHPDQIYLPPHLKHLRSKEWLTTAEVGQIVFGRTDSLGCTREWIRHFKIPKTNKGKALIIAFRDVERTVLSLLPAGFPFLDREQGLRYSEALCVCRINDLNGYASYQCMFQPITYRLVCTRLGRSNKTMSIFEKHGLRDENGGQLFILSHMFRHYLNTVAQAGGLSDIEIAKWSGRKVIAQNQRYDHESDRDVMAKIRNAIGDTKLAVGPLANMDKRMLISRAKFADIKVITAHTNELGYCLHDFASLPCQTHGDHINCNEQVYIKGDTERENNLRCLQAETCSLLEKAKQALTDEEYGADTWVQHQMTLLGRLNQILQIIDDPTVQPGAVIQPSGIVPASRLVQAMEQRITGDIPLFGGRIRSIDDVRQLLAAQNREQEETHDPTQA